MNLIRVLPELFGASPFLFWSVYGIIHTLSAVGAYGVFNHFVSIVALRKGLRHNIMMRNVTTAVISAVTGPLALIMFVNANLENGIPPRLRFRTVK